MSYMEYATPKKVKPSSTIVSSPMLTMERLLNREQVANEEESTDIINLMKKGSLFTHIFSQDNQYIQKKVFVYYRKDTSIGSLVLVPINNDIIPEPLDPSIPLPENHLALSMRRVTDIWLGKQTPELDSFAAVKYSVDLCWTIFHRSSQSLRPSPNDVNESINLVAETEKILNDWLTGLNLIMTNGGRQLIKKPEGDEATTPVPKVPSVRETGHPTESSLGEPSRRSRASQGRRFSVQPLLPEASNHPQSRTAANTAANASTGSATNAVILQAKMRSFKSRLNSSLSSSLSAAKLSIDEQRTLIDVELSSFQSCLEHHAFAITQRVTQNATSIKNEKISILQALKRERELRVRLMNQLIEEHGNIRVFVRVRPLSSREMALGDESCLVLDEACNENRVYANEEEELLDSIAGQENSLAVLNVDSHGAIIEEDSVGLRSGSSSFQFDKVFGPDTTQSTVGREVLPFIRSCLDGYNVCIFAYGHSGSGKTYTMEGSEANPGVNYTALNELFRQIEANKATLAKVGQDVEYRVEVAVIEVYNEIPKDLLRVATAGRANEECKVDIRLGEAGVVVPGLTRVEVNSSEDVRHLLSTRAKPNRSVGKTNMNAESSRSHCALFVHVEAFNRHTRETTNGKLVLVDLAGSERVNKSGVEGLAMKEAQNINKSLSALGDVIQALQNKEKHVPYRNSKLTFLLQDCLGGNAKCLMFCNISPACCNQNETLCSLRFAARARNTQLGKAKKNTPGVSSARSNAENEQVQAQLKLKSDEVKSIQREVQGLREENQALLSEVETLRVHSSQHYKPLLEQQKLKDNEIAQLKQTINEMRSQIKSQIPPSTRPSTRTRASVYSSNTYRPSVAGALPESTPRKRKSYDMREAEFGEEENVGPRPTPARATPSVSRRYTGAVVTTSASLSKTGSLRQGTLKRTGTKAGLDRPERPGVKRDLKASLRSSTIPKPKI